MTANIYKYVDMMKVVHFEEIFRKTTEQMKKGNL
jgi:hypothetical protein